MTRKSVLSYMNLRMAVIACFLSLVAMSDVRGQGTEIPLNTRTYNLVDRFEIKYGRIFPLTHSSIKPYSRKHIALFADSLATSNIEGGTFMQANVDYLLRDNDEWVKSKEIKSERPILRYFYREPASLYSVKKDGFILRFNPVLNYEIAKEWGVNKHKYINSRGVEMRAYIKKRLGIYTFIAENQVKGPTYYNIYEGGHEAIPGEGFYKEFKITGYDFFTARGHVSVNLWDAIDFQFGHGKNFIGNGYRSLILSDFSNNYFFLKINTRIWKINYQNIFAELTHQYERGLDRLLTKKYAAMHFLNINVSPHFEFGLFEGVIFARENTFELQYLNPIIFYRSIEQELRSPHNAIIGLDVKANFAHRFQFYMQFVLDEFKLDEVFGRTGWWANKYGLQTGLKYVDMLGIENLDGQFEFNVVRPFTYTHNQSYANYTHYNQPLAHPWGANFHEVIGILRFVPAKNLDVELKAIHIRFGEDEVGENFGQNIFKSSVNEDGSLAVQQEFANEVGQGRAVRYTLVNLRPSYMVFHNVFLEGNLYLHWRNRKWKDFVDSDYYTGVSVRINIARRTYDF